MLLEAGAGNYRQALSLILAAVGCVLLIACANVANLQLARDLSRSKELAVRAALGASRWRLARQLLAESGVLAVGGALLGVLFAIWSLDAILALSPAKVPRFQTRIDMSALLFTGIVALGSGFLVGIWPAWRISRLASSSIALHEAGSRGGSDSARRHRTSDSRRYSGRAGVILPGRSRLTLKFLARSEDRSDSTRAAF